MYQDQRMRKEYWEKVLYGRRQMMFSLLAPQPIAPVFTEQDTSVGKRWHIGSGAPTRRTSSASFPTTPSTSTTSSSSGPGTSSLSASPASGSSTGLFNSCSLLLER